MSKGRQLELEWSEHQGLNCLRVRGWTKTEIRELGGLATAEFSQRLVVLPSELLEFGVELGTIPAIAGRFEADGDSVCFLPRFPFLDGMGYSLLVGAATEDKGVSSREVWNIQRPVPEVAPATDVVAIYPSGNQMPVNQLKLYVHFSNPMSEGCVARAVQVRRADNNEPLQGVFLTMEPELWDLGRRRLTLLLDPGRIKRGLVPNAEEGYPLIEGVPVILTISTDFRDAAGRPLRTSGERRYEIGPLVRVKVNPTNWRCDPPAAGTTDQLTVEFCRPLDHALLQHSLWINDATGLALAGRGSVGLDERSWCFRPELPWAGGQHQVVIDPSLEDLSGNSLLRVFDRDIMKIEDAPNNVQRFALDFSCAPSPKPAPLGQKLST